MDNGVTNYLRNLPLGSHPKRYDSGKELSSLLSIGYRMNTMGDHPFSFSFKVNSKEKIVTINVLNRQ